ncbi:MAG: hypothetical protein COV91_00660 [Candidatus Taylorbacteria bacterium CG11_big_fil_rev_8_21_14_0_20_46_11]|uniref:Uncharacterized protein n=1 Tax=Candidatus Taylorbacteria bacterium CG11_big_fil_rev_8_21_14_0_20_46_11 TaxID=1975025 RepID=A0A2H0KET0_9BACT|nr:MAG: hypothetical protein COV91_00660 [Candidatus Taylorbacteria bacterium CG11_big_fil_rev_8_21_14_0_20_46_11]
MNLFCRSTEQKLGELHSAVRRQIQIQTAEQALVLDNLSREVVALCLRDAIVSTNSCDIHNAVRFHRSVVYAHELCEMAITVREFLVNHRRADIERFERRHRQYLKRKGHWFVLIGEQGRLLMQACKRATLKHRFPRNGTRGIVCKVAMNRKTGERTITISSFIERPCNLKEE